MGKLLRLMFIYLSACLSLQLVTACSMHGAPLSELEQVAKRDEFIAAGGYSIARSYEIDSVGERWWRDGKALDALLSAPRKAGSYPLIIYLPGLGESADSGRFWREYWAKAGYAVLSVQTEALARAFADLAPEFPENSRGEDLFEVFRGEETLDDASEDGDKMPTQAALNGERRYISHGFFTDKSLKIRIDDLLWIYAQCQKQAQAKQGLFAKADLSKVVLAGYDIGADTIVGWLMGQSNDDPTANRVFQPLAAILLSPIVAASSGDMRERYRSIRLPLLAISSDQDSDTYGITTAQLRRSIWDHAASRDKYLLLLEYARHALFSGSDWTSHGRGEPGRGGRGAGSGAARPDFVGHFQGEGRRRDGPPSGIGGLNRSDSSATVAVHQQIGAVLSVSTAFLDSIAKSDNFAKLWLRQNAPAWLKHVGRLTGS